MVYIMLINVFKEKASKKFGDFKIHCIMDEIGSKTDNRRPSIGGIDQDHTPIQRGV